MYKRQDKELPFILASCHDKDDYEQEAMRRGATLCMDKMKGQLVQDKLVEYAYRQLSLSLIHISAHWSWMGNLPYLAATAAACALTVFLSIHAPVRICLLYTSRCV